MGLTAVLADDHPVYRRGLAMLLAEEGVEVLAQAATAAECLAAVDAAPPDVVVLDLHLPDRSGVEVARTLATSHPTVGVLVLSMDASDASTLAALRAGARGYLLKESAADGIARAVGAVARGELHLDALLAGRVAGLLASAGASASSPQGLADMSPRELEVLALVAEGLGNVEIGRKLFLAEKTVRNHVTALLAKTGAPGRPALVALARDAGLGGSPRRDAAQRARS
ncbi:response regulator transcription factor [Cellulomonas marina]|uniref:DNA-binding response regulator, NarL/FixJ family, contains REC and HTH domains n=1 Tax=Cellulomonas marina TaxID=988821 RepID=A0A1I1ALA1_9CELL|nr:response regulator transcription factor [Cellulomonas marina]GIG30195.1 DNA-binding response regulator [Cellulomonas marina]SFB37103.1 DNA-binding response regulator, NarL/FixJ family, contains REC and HTH domains [Cellulomonas marina]